MFKIYLWSSVTRFGEISPLWPSLQNLCQFFEVFLSYLAKLSFLWPFLWYCTNVHCCKWPNYWIRNITIWWHCYGKTDLRVALLIQSVNYFRLQNLRSLTHSVFLKNGPIPAYFCVYFHLFIAISIIQIEKAFMVCLGFEPTTAVM